MRRLNDANVIRVLRCTGFDHCEDVWWRLDGPRGDSDNLRIFIQCSDFFAWATADMEEVTDENVAMLEQAMKDSIDATGDRFPLWGPQLFCARVRKRLPMPEALRGMDPEMVPLFNATAPPIEGVSVTDRRAANA